MGYRFPKKHAVNREIIEPDDLNLNFKEYVDEINGNLSRENLKLAEETYLVNTQFKNGAFSEVFHDAIWADGDWEEPSSADRAALIPSTNTTGYTSEGQNGNKMPSIEFMAERDGWVIIDFNASHVWHGTGLLSKGEAERKLIIKRHWPYQHWDRLAQHNSDLPCGGWIGITCRDSEDIGIKASDEVYHMSYTSSPDWQYTGLWAGGFPQGKYVLQPVDRYGIKYRITLNGSEICETGWLYNGKDRNGCYTCGVIPIRAGRNIIKSEVAVANVENLWGTTQGVRSENDGGVTDNFKKGKFFPKSFISSENNLSTLPERRTETFDRYDAVDSELASDMASTGEVYSLKLGIECWIGNANLVVQYRKG